MIRSYLTPLAAFALATGALAQTQQCFTAAVASQPTDWASSVTIPKFDSGLGTLLSVSVQLDARIEGDAKIENFAPSPVAATLLFQGEIQVQRPDTSVIVLASPSVAFADALSGFDGTIDFDGTSGESHLGVVGNASNTASFTNPPDDLSLFVAPPASGQTITLPVTARGTSTATGSGNVITQFTQVASAQIVVCYTYAPNNPPVCNVPAVVMGSVGVPLSFQVCGSDTDATDTVTITSGPLPAGMTITPALPQSGNPVCVTVDWTPSNADVGNTVVTFTLTDSHARTTTCTTTLVIAECHMLFAMGGGNASYTIFGHLYDTQLQGVRRFYPVTMEDAPSFAYDQLPRTFFVQVVMYNPTVFPQNPSQWSHRMRVDKVQPSQLTYTLEGTQNGIPIQAATFMSGNQLRVRFPFQVNGM